ncbi:MAG: threonine synthase [Sporomusaceae bacterium]|nr:threonine synthase [Sporomusaceae bacterium]
MQFACSSCHKTYDDSNYKWRCDCGGYLALDHHVKFTKDDIKTERYNMWRYDEAFPLKYEDLKATYNEGLTPLVNTNHSQCRLRIKMESLMPTGSFKDRGTVMVVNYLINKGVEKITEDSSGNAGASVAAYCALGRIPCEIYVPKGNSAGKLIQIKSYGAEIHEIGGTREDVAQAAQQEFESYAGHNWHPMFVEGTKAIAYEIWEQNGFEAPENVVAVAGNGSTILGIYYGFKDLFANKQVTRLPRLFAVQAENCNPIYREFAGVDNTSPFKSTVAEGIALAKPNKGDRVIEAVRETGGAVLSISEDKIIAALKEIISKGFYIEPTSATAYAGVKELLATGIFEEADDVVMIASGNGLKAGAEITELLHRNH